MFLVHCCLTLSAMVVSLHFYSNEIIDLDVRRVTSIFHRFLLRFSSILMTVFARTLGEICKTGKDYASLFYFDNNVIR